MSAVRSDRRAHQPWVRDLQQLRRKGVVNQGDDVTVVVLPKKKSLSAFRVAMRLSGAAGVLMGLLFGVPIFIGVQEVGAQGIWNQPNFYEDIQAAMLITAGVWVKFGLWAALALFLWAAVRDGILSALGVVLLVWPAGLVIWWAVVCACVLAGHVAHGF